jgi:hypothetical protein
MANAPGSEPIDVSTPDAGAPIEPDVLPLRISTLAVDTQGELPPLDAHELSTSPIGLIESAPQAKIIDEFEMFRRLHAKRCRVACGFDRRPSLEGSRADGGVRPRPH